MYLCMEKGSTFMVYMRTMENDYVWKSILEFMFGTIFLNAIYLWFLYRNFWIFISFYMRFFGMFLFCNKNMNEIYKKF